MILTNNNDSLFNSQGDNGSFLMTVREVAAILRVSPSLVYRLVDAGKIGSFRIGKGRGAIRISRDSVNQFLASSQAAPSEQKTDRTHRASLRHLKL
jgi:excisionase family DNA binding protein